MPYLVHGGLLVDGSGEPPRMADVLVAGDKIVSIGSLRERTGDTVEIDATGCVVAPGFIDIHSHSDYTLAVDPRAVSAVHQGVTLEVVGNCGHGCFPVQDGELGKRAVYGFSRDLDAFRPTAVEYFLYLEERQPAVNVISLVPHGQVRLSAMGLTDDATSTRDVDNMTTMLTASLEAGAWGFSSGLEYAAERGATVEDLSTLCRTVERFGGLYATHTRFRNEGAVDGIEEALQVARNTGVRLQISHLVPRGGYEDTVRCIELVEAAKASGLDVAFDMHTRLHGFTYLHVGLPPQALEGSPSEIARRLGSASFRAEVAEYRAMFNFSRDADRIILATGDPAVVDLSLAEVGRLRGQSASEVAFDILVENVEHLNDVMVSLPTYTQEQQMLAFTHPDCMPASDATTLAPDGPLGDQMFPGAYSWASWYFRFLYDRLGEGALAEIVRKLSSLPAARLALADRGQIKVGAFADLVMFDPSEYRSNTSAGREKLASGIQAVMVNGRLVLNEGSLTGERPGRVLRRV